MKPPRMGEKGNQKEKDQGQKTHLGTSLVAQWLRLCLPMKGVWVQSPVRELRSHVPQGIAKKIKNKQVSK
jgi:hypothetical protein